MLNSLGAQPRLHVDGRVGKATMKALREADAHRVQALFQEGRRDYYRNLVTLRPSLARFLKGWLRRVDSFDVASDTTRSA